MLGCEPFAWMLRGVYIGLPPGGTMVIRLGSGVVVVLAGCWESASFLAGFLESATP